MEGCLAECHESLCLMQETAVVLHAKAAHELSAQQAHVQPEDTMALRQCAHSW